MYCVYYRGALCAYLGQVPLIVEDGGRRHGGFRQKAAGGSSKAGAREVNAVEIT